MRDISKPLVVPTVSVVELVSLSVDVDRSSDKSNLLGIASSVAGLENDRFEGQNVEKMSGRTLSIKAMTKGQTSNICYGNTDYYSPYKDSFKSG
jgi:hypothetical protein